MTLFTLVKADVENFLVDDAVCGLLIGPRNQGIRYSSKENQKKMVKTYVTIRGSPCEILISVKIRSNGSEKEI